MLFKAKVLAAVFGIAVGLTVAPMSAIASIGKVLVVVSGVDYVALKGGSSHPTGYFLSELAVPVGQLVKAGYEIVVANPNGNTPAMDVVSDSARWFTSEGEYRQAKSLIDHIPGMTRPRRLASMGSAELAGFDGIFLPGGHAPMQDLYSDADLGRILRYFHHMAKPTALICHAPIALLSATDASRSWDYSGYQMTVFSTAEEQQEETAGRLGGKLTFYVAEALRTAGARVTVAAPWNAEVIQDRELITGQNPMSDQQLASVFLAALTKSKLSKALHAQFDANQSIHPGVAYQVIGHHGETVGNYTTLFVGTRRDGIAEADFLLRLKQHVIEVKRVLSARGLLGYQFLATGDLELAYLSWASELDANTAFSTAEAQAFAAEAGMFMENAFFKQVQQ